MNHSFSCQKCIQLIHCSSNKMCRIATATAEEDMSHKTMQEDLYGSRGRVQLWKFDCVTIDFDFNG